MNINNRKRIVRIEIKRFGSSLIYTMSNFITISPQFTNFSGSFQFASKKQKRQKEITVFHFAKGLIYIGFRQLFDLLNNSRYKSSLPQFFPSFFQVSPLLPLSSY